MLGHIVRIASDSVATILWISSFLSDPYWDSVHHITRTFLHFRTAAYMSALLKTNIFSFQIYFKLQYQEQNDNILNHYTNPTLVYKIHNNLKIIFIVISDDVPSFQS